MAKKQRVYTPHKLTPAKAETVTVADGKFQPGQRVRLAHALTIKNSGKVDTGIVRSVKREGDYEYAVVAVEPYGNLVMTATSTLVLAPMSAKEKA